MNTANEDANRRSEALDRVVRISEGLNKQLAQNPTWLFLELNDRQSQMRARFHNASIVARTEELMEGFGE